MPSENPRRPGSRATLVGLAIATAALLLVPGCNMPRTTLDGSIAERHADPAAELDFWDEVTERYVVTNHDALHGLLLLDPTVDPPADFESCVTAARGLGWIDDDPLAPNESAAVGWIAIAACDLMEIRGGLTMRMIGRTRRACTRELVFRSVLPPRSANQTLSGLEFMDLVSRIDDTMQRNEMATMVADGE